MEIEQTLQLPLNKVCDIFTSSKVNSKHVRTMKRTHRTVWETVGCIWSISMLTLAPGMNSLV